jgi:hypothetical protein
MGLGVRSQYGVAPLVLSEVRLSSALNSEFCDGGAGDPVALVGTA